MSAGRVCDICGSSEAEVSRQTGQGTALRRDSGLWLCRDCRTRVAARAEVDAPVPDPDEPLGRVIGKSAGAICRTLNLPYEPPYREVIDAASKIAYDQDRYMSAWICEALWLDGTTVWRAEDGTALALVYADGSVDIQPA